ncbi:MAG: NRDE family protein [Zoogloeaceae bacterium]|jgi:uncharacterized protein with NRDE domain|nr:NRDE family protein [Zoogloeaceae bacterium]
MCLILFAWRVLPDYPLVLAANRDEFYRRPSLPLARWADAPEVLGGRDQQAGGGWLACHVDGRFAAVTNVREGVAARVGAKSGAKSRGQLVADYLRGKLPPAEFVAATATGDHDDYDGFNLLAGDRRELHYLSNRNGVVARSLPPGIHALSNHCLDTPWPKVVSARAAFAAALSSLPATDDFFRLLADRALAPDEDLPQTGVPLATERMLSAVFIASPDYGTRASTLLLAHGDGRMSMQERRFGAEGCFLEERAVTIDANRHDSC